jgi:non-specific serine/threonine protein kinase/serine/threonine-protein kinase
MTPEQPENESANEILKNAETDFSTLNLNSAGSPVASDIGPYHLIQLLGEGGMGEVWLAEQKHPVRRRVAVKLIKAGMNTREVVARFESERQALALMDHPAIAKVFDAGSTPEGRPYFVMEYVAGQPITSYCDRNKLTMRQRMELFIQVCEGVQHAHQKAIIHRDLKPSNILVTEVDGKPMPRIIDFGVAKATSQSLSVGTMYTQFGAVIGTLGYMSPEQADSAGQDIDTRSDVYSLGVVLYELLVGALPLDFGKMAYDEVLRALREEDAPKPSTKVRTGQSAIDAAKIAKQRSVDPPTLTRQLRGDPDAIALKALEKDRKRRYASPSELASDIGRYLRNEPVSAHAPSAVYRARKYVRRHRVGVVIAGLAVLLLIGFAVAQAVELRRIRRERDRADRVTEFMTNMFKVSDPSQARGNDIKVREVLDKASTEIDIGLDKDPELQAQMMQVMGTVYDDLGLYPQAESLTRRALATQVRVLGKDNRVTLKSMANLGLILSRESKFVEAEKVGREAYDTDRRLFGLDDRSTLEAVDYLASTIADEGHYPEAEKLNAEAMEAAHRKLGPMDQLTTELAVGLAIDYAYEAKFPEAEKEFREVLQLDRERLGPDHPSTLKAMNNLGSILLRERKFAESEKTYRELLVLQRRVMGPQHPATLLVQGNLALALTDEQHYTEAEQLFRETLEAKRRKLGPENRSTLVTEGNLADVLFQEGKYPESEQLNSQTLAIERRTLGNDHSDTQGTMQSLGSVLTKEGRYSEGEKLLREAYDTRLRVLGHNDSDTAEAAYALSKCYVAEGKKDEAFAILTDAVDHGMLAADDLDIPVNPDLKPLQADPRFAVLVADAQKHAASTSPAK